MRITRFHLDPMSNSRQLAVAFLVEPRIQRAEIWLFGKKIESEDPFFLCVLCETLCAFAVKYQSTTKPYDLGGTE